MLNSGVFGGEIMLLDFWSPSCGPCLQMKPTIHNFERAGYPIQQVDTSRDPVLTRQYGVERIPCFVMLVDNQEVERKVGAISGEELQAMFARAKQIVEDRARGRGQSPDSAQPSLAKTSSPSQLLSAAAARGPAESVPVEASPAESHEKLLAATVRLRVDDAQGHAYGTGTIIDSRSGQALVITCGHLFRESKGKGPVFVETFEAVPGGVHVVGQVPAQVISYNLERDVALVGIWPTRPVTVARLAPKGSAIGRGNRVVSIGCSNGNDPSALATRITNLDRYQGPANIEIQGAPVEGRSGGGLFNANGELIGVCYAADYEGNEGLYAALSSIHDELAEQGLSEISGQIAAQPNDSLNGPAVAPGTIVRGQEPLTPVQPIPERETATPAGLTVAVDDAKSNAESVEIPQGLSDAEQAAWEEIMTRASAAEVICIIRPKDPGGQSEVITLDGVSPEFVRALLARQQNSREPVRAR
jgi:thiol-disulfide isomerase/thioredoxin